MRRRPTRDVDLAEVKEDGERVSVLCTVIDFDPRKGEGTVDDGTSVARVILEDFLFAEKMKPGSKVRIIGRAYKSDEGLLIRAEIVHDMSRISPATYKKVRELERRVWNESGV